MRTVRKNVYYCDYCKKRGLVAGAMIKHERHCTANPDRHCRVCGREEPITDYVESLKKRFEINSDDKDNHYVVWHSEPITLDEIRTMVGNCPNCIFAVLRQTKLNYNVFGITFDYKEELARWWEEH